VARMAENKIISVGKTEGKSPLRTSKTDVKEIT
jgi:hypothetical protein